MGRKSFSSVPVFARLCAQQMSNTSNFSTLQFRLVMPVGAPDKSERALGAQPNLALVGRPTLAVAIGRAQQFHHPVGRT